MRRGQLLRVTAGLVLAIGCENLTATSGSAILTGTWARPPENLAPSGWYEVRFTFTPSGAFTQDVRNYGIYPGQPRDELSAYTRTEGTYRTEGDRLILAPHRLVVWDRFYGPTSPEIVYDPYPYKGSFGDLRYTVLGDTLTLRYTTYPADAPVPTTMVLNRVR